MALANPDLDMQLENMNSTDLPLVCVLMPTYNHGKFIEQAITGVIFQKTNFKYQLIIGDDFSNDSTIEICKKYHQLYPDKIKLLLHESNLGLNGKINFMEIYKAANSKYIAFCEGDDYWTDSYKLQKQVDFLESNPDYSICFTNANFITEQDQFNVSDDNVLIDKNIKTRTIEQEELFESNCILTLTTVFRNQHIQFPGWFMKVNLGDWAIHIIHSFYGKIKYFDDITATYRTHGNGIFSTRPVKQQMIQYLNTGKIIGENLQKDQAMKMNSGQAKRLVQLLNICLKRKNRIEYYQQLIKYGTVLSTRQRLRYILKGLSFYRK